MPLYLSVPGLASGHITKVPDFSSDIINKDVFVMGCGCAWVLKCVALKVVFNNLKLGCFVTITLIEFALEKINCSKKFGEQNYCIRTLPRGGMYWEIHPPRAISRAEGCKIPARGKSRGPRGMYFPMHPDSRQCTSILSALAGKY